MLDEHITEEIMQEVEKLNRSIREYCPEIISSDFLEATKTPADRMNSLIDSRIRTLTERTTCNTSSTRP